MIRPTFQHHHHHHQPHHHHRHQHHHHQVQCNRLDWTIISIIIISNLSAFPRFLSPFASLRINGARQPHLHHRTSSSTTWCSPVQYIGKDHYHYQHRRHHHQQHHRQVQSSSGPDWTISISIIVRLSLDKAFHFHFTFLFQICRSKFF